MLMEFLWSASHPGCFGSWQVGLAMSHEDDMASLHNVYETEDEDATTKSTKYIIQFLQCVSLMWLAATTVVVEHCGPTYFLGIVLHGHHQSISMGVSGVFRDDTSH